LFFQGFFSPHAPNESGTEDWTGGLKSTMRWSSPAIRGRLQFHRAFQSGLVLGLVLIRRDGDGDNRRPASTPVVGAKAGPSRLTSTSSIIHAWDEAGRFSSAPM
jgi:hypothetical protein